MPRPSRKTDERLIKAAQDLMKSSSLSQLNLREVAGKAAVNLGMFHYHFKTKDQFIKAVLKDTYERFFETFSLKVDSEKEPLQKLRQALVTLAHFSQENRHLILSLLQDALNREPTAKDFAKQLMSKHSQVIVGLLTQCQAQGLLQRAPLPMLMSYIMPAATGEGMVLGIMEHVGAEPAMIEHFKKTAFTEEAIARRVDWVLAGLAEKKVAAKKTKKKA